jgi:hypothetical protein
MRPTPAGPQLPSRLYNTIVTIIANLEAADPVKAFGRLARAAETAGFDIYSHGTSPGDAFEAEDGQERAPAVARVRHLGFSGPGGQQVCYGGWSGDAGACLAARYRRGHWFVAS